MIAIPAQAVRDAQAAGELWPVLLAIAGPESSWNPSAIGDNGTSFGYLQFHQGGGLGDGHAVSNLLDGGYNMRLGAQYIGGRLAQGASLWDALQPWSTRPQAIALLGRLKVEGIQSSEGGTVEVPAQIGGSALAPTDGMVILAAAVLALLILR